MSEQVLSEDKLSRLKHAANEVIRTDGGYTAVHTFFGELGANDVLALVEFAEASKALLKYIDDHDWGFIPEGLEGDRMRDALAKLDTL